MKPLAVFYHSWYAPNAFPIIKEQMETLRDSGLLAEASHITVGLNGKPDGEVWIPPVNIIVHPEGSANENLTMVEAHEFAKKNPDWYVLYFHSKGATHEPGHWCIPLMTNWRNCMMEHCVKNWKTCVDDLQTHEAVGVHWLDASITKNFPYFGGNFWWARSEFLATIPSLYERHKTRTGNLWDWDNRYEAEVWLGQAPRLPIVKDYHPGHPGIHG